MCPTILVTSLSLHFQIRARKVSLSYSAVIQSFMKAFVSNPRNKLKITFISWDKQHKRIMHQNQENELYLNNLIFLFLSLLFLTRTQLRKLNCTYIPQILGLGQQYIKIQCTNRQYPCTKQTDSSYMQITLPSITSLIRG